jgi:hypothetical protein
MEAVIFRHEFCMAILPPMSGRRPLTVAIMYRGRKQAAELSIRKNKAAPLRDVPIHQGVYINLAVPGAARNTAYERPFIVLTSKLTGASFMVIELTWRPRL